jgi:hypothetical protein
VSPRWTLALGSVTTRPAAVVEVLTGCGVVAVWPGASDVVVDADAAEVVVTAGDRLEDVELVPEPFEDGLLDEQPARATTPATINAAPPRATRDLADWSSPGERSSAAIIRTSESGGRHDRLVSATA